MLRLSFVIILANFMLPTPDPEIPESRLLVLTSKRLSFVNQSCNWTVQQTHFSTSSSPNPALTPLKSASKILSNESNLVCSSSAWSLGLKPEKTNGWCNVGVINERTRVKDEPIPSYHRKQERNWPLLRSLLAYPYSIWTVSARY